MVKKSTSDAPSASEYNALVNSAELMDIKLIRSDFDVRPSYFSADEDDLTFRYTCEIAQSFYREGEHHLFAEVALMAGSKLGRKWVLKARSTYLVAYVLDDATTERAAVEYLNKVARFTAFPYFRAHFAEHCSQAGAHMPPLPVLKGNIPKKVDNKAEGPREAISSRV